jgi:thiol-disulfide isomerase/thioredoxin
VKKSPFTLLLCFFLAMSCAPKKAIIGQSSDHSGDEIVTNPEDNKDQRDSLETYVDKDAIKINFETDNKLSDVLDKAAAENKLVYLDLNATWCTPCKLMQRDVYTHRPTASFFNQNFINHIVDIDKGEGPDLKLIYDIKVIPTLLWLDGRGRVVHRREGAAYHAELIKNAEDAMASKK